MSESTRAEKLKNTEQTTGVESECVGEPKTEGSEITIEVPKGVGLAETRWAIEGWVQGLFK